MSTYKTKNYKGNIIETLENFQKKFPNKKIIKVTESNSGLSIITEDNQKDPAEIFLTGAVEKFKNEKLNPADWKKLDDRLWEEMQQFFDEYKSTYNLGDIKKFALSVDKKWMDLADKNTSDKMFMALGDSTRQMMIKALQ